MDQENNQQAAQGCDVAAQEAECSLQPACLGGLGQDTDRVNGHQYG